MYMSVYVEIFVKKGKFRMKCFEKYDASAEGARQFFFSYAN